MAAERDQTSDGFLDQLIGEAMNSGIGDSWWTRGVFHVILGVTGPSSEAADGDPSPPPPNRIVLVNSVIQGMVVLQAEPAVVAEILSEMGLGGAPPASNSSIEAMRKVDIEGDDLVECPVCLEALGGGGGGEGGRGRGEAAAPAVSEMPCGHLYHEECIVKWLAMHGSCPVCRFQMPVEEDSGTKKGDDEQEGRAGRRRGLWVTIVYSQRSARRD